MEGRGVRDEGEEDCNNGGGKEGGKQRSDVRKQMREG